MNTELLRNIIKQFMPFAQDHIGFKDPPRLFLRNDSENAKNPLGKTAFYDPAAKSVTLYITGRHPKDVLRSLGHELVHHKQNCEGQFDSCGDTGPGYAQENPHLRQMEMDANRDGSMCLRDFEDMLKKQNTIYYEHLQKGENKMSTKDWKNKEVTQLLAEAWGFKFNSLEEFNEFNGSGELQAEAEEEVVEEAEEEVVEEAEEEVNEEEVDEGLTGAALGMMAGGPVGAYAGHKAQDVADKYLDDDDEEVNEEEEVNEDEEVVEESEEETLQEAITRILRKHLKG